jgi:hypothetical protein
VKLLLKQKVDIVKACVGCGDNMGVYWYVVKE